MTPTRIAGGTHIFTRPKNWDDSNGSCGDLPVRVAGPVFASAWAPTPEQLAVLNAGGHVVVSVFGGQPPIAVTVEPPQAELPTEE